MHIIRFVCIIWLISFNLFNFPAAKGFAVGNFFLFLPCRRIAGNAEVRPVNVPAGYSSTLWTGAAGSKLLPRFCFQIRKCKLHRGLS